MDKSAPARELSRAERVSDAVIHITGLAIALMALPVLVTLAAFWRGDITAVVAIAVYAVTALAMFLCSALYHMVPHPGWKGVLRRLDHTAIYFKIAGTYTPFAALSGTHAGAFLTGLWAAAIAGSGIKILSPDRLRWLAFALYLAMGWAGVTFGWALISELSTPVFVLILTGGLIYTAGTAFYLWDMLPYNIAIWHGFVLVASLMLYAAVLLHLADTSLSDIAEQIVPEMMPGPDAPPP